MIQSKRIRVMPFWLIFVALSLLQSCASVAKFDQKSFEQTIDVKVEAIALMKKATEEFSIHESQVEDITKVMQKLYEYDKRRTHNELTTKMWEVIISEDKNLAGGYFKRWEEINTLNPAFITEASLQVEQAFDLLLDFESRKDKTEENALGTIINSFINHL